ncbi:MAG: hypothetical protein JWQ90_4529 [Hydrocarboniphaga sp.]|uniref:hypothetical protein n=1 Tax=Hydrocarboniphaga sp. TaxID=2033016 RepID=UPI002625B464|nr:hypothetical protein [Hydrocarboniphaga sp.]MDB5972079.1 hypothetical protein [Hydrocarboniphaga sp.]
MQGQGTPHDPGSSSLPIRIAQLVLAVLLLHAADAAAAERWWCKQQLPGGDCIGPTTLTDGRERTVGNRGLPPGKDQVVWLGPVTYYDRLGVRSVCTYAPSGRCEGELTTYFPYGKRRVESLRVVDGAEEYLGVTSTFYPDGKRLDCRVNKAGDCDGESVVQLASKEILHGTQRAFGYDSKWIGTGRWIFPGGQIKDCLVGDEGECKPGPLTLWDRDGKTLGTLGADGLLTGAITLYDRRGYKKYCALATAGSCKTRDLVVTRAPPGAAERPLPKKASMIRPAEIRAALTRLTYVVFSPEPDRAEIRYRFLACGDDIRIAYTVVHAVRSKVPFKGQVWNGAQLVGTFDDRAAGPIPTSQLICASPQTRTLASLRNHQMQLRQHTFVDGSELWSLPDMIQQFLDRLTVRTLPVVEPVLAAPIPIPVPVPLPAAAAARR